MRWRTCATGGRFGSRRDRRCSYATAERLRGTEERLARDFGLDRERLAAEMAALWRQSFHAERDRRAGGDANAQKKGRVARELKAELRKVLDGDD